MQDNFNDNNINNGSSSQGTNVQGRPSQRQNVQGRSVQRVAQPRQNIQGRPVQGSGQPRQNVQGRPVQGSGQQRQNIQGRPVQGLGQPRQNVQGRPVQRTTQPGQNVQGRPMQGSGQPRQNAQGRPVQRTTQPRQNVQGRPVQGSGQQRQNVKGRPVQGSKKAAGNNAKNTSKKVNSKQVNLTPEQIAKKKRNKIILFIAEIVLCLVLVVVFWGITKASKIKVVTIDDEKVEINEQVKEATETGVLKGYRNIAVFGVDSREGELDKNTRTDTIIIASVNLDTSEIKMVSVYRDTWLNLSTDTYGKANSAYSKGGPQQAISMLNMNLDMNITDFVTVGFDAVIDMINAVGGVEINVKEEEIVHLNSFQKSITGKPDGTLNAAGEPNYAAREGIDYEPVTKAGEQTLNGVQALAYMRIRQVGNDFARTERQRTVIEKFAKKAVTLNPTVLNKLAESVFPKVATSLDMAEIMSLLGDVAKFNLGAKGGFPFEGSVATGKIGTQSVVIPVDLEKNVTLLHEFLFNEAGYVPSETVKKCSQKIVNDSGKSASQ